MGEATEPVLKRKAATSRAGHPGAGSSEALARAVAAAARRVLAAEVSVDPPDCTGMELAALLESVPEHGLVLLLGGRDGGEGAGLAVLEPALTEALVAQRITGAPAAAREPRAPTPVDAALTGDFVDMLLSGLAAVPGLEAAAALAVTGQAERVPPLRFSLPPGGWRVTGFAFTLAGTEHGGRLTLALPEASGADDESRRAWAGRRDSAVRAAPIVLRAVLHRARLPLRDLERLESGDRLDLPAAALDAVRLEAGRRAVFTGRLGQARGQRAVRLGPPAPVMLTAEEGVNPAGGKTPEPPPAGCAPHAVAEEASAADDQEGSAPATGALRG